MGAPHTAWGLCRLGNPAAGKSSASRTAQQVNPGRRLPRARPQSSIFLNPDKELQESGKEIRLGNVVSGRAGNRSEHEQKRK